MATISSTGIGSGLDVNALVTQLVAAERAPYDTRLAKVDTKLTTEFTALSQLKGSLGTFQTALATLKDAATFAPRKTTVEDEDIFTATASTAAAPGSYDIEVEQLAKPAQLASTAIVGGATAVAGTGTLALSLGATTFSITLGDSAKSLGDLRDAINGAADNPGIRATLVNGIDGTRLLLSGAKTGEVNAIKVKASGADVNLTRFVYDPPTTTNLNVVSAGRDAIVHIGDAEFHSATNSVDGAIEGITLQLHAADVGATHTLDVEYDRTAIQDRVQKFADAYNALAQQIAKLRSYDSTTKVAGPLLGDAMLRNIETQLRRVLSDPVQSAKGAFTTLASLGVTTTVSGTLQVDATKLGRALDTDINAVATVFSAKDGVATRLDTFLNEQLSSAGEIAARNTGIDARRKDLEGQREAVETRIAAIQARYLKQFSALDSLLSQLQSTSSYLARQLSVNNSSS